MLYNQKSGSQINNEILLNFRTMVLQYKVHYTTRPSSTRDAPAGHEDLKWVPSSSVLIYGEHDAVLVDTALTINGCQDVLDFVIASGKNLKYIYITHPHGDHYFGIGVLKQHFPDARAIATKEAVEEMKKDIGAIPGERLTNVNTFRKLFPGEIPDDVQIAEALEGDEFEIEGEKFKVVKTGHTDTDCTSTLFVPSIGLALTGDAVYYNVHPFMAETKSPELRKEWVAALDKIVVLKPKLLVGGHKDPSTEDSPEAIEWTKGYFGNLERLAKETTSVEELYEKMLVLYPKALNPGSCWGAAKIMKS
jgi:glyoxylase-like metal-dependent hydrolase (beta-lactamase superfamily II)